ncbi:MAG: hypothetical protein L0Y35_08915 [Flammeovirgaceae bacterium]|nr:hypothetical protein [Flammeovirgaceae bacterium]
MSFTKGNYTPYFYGGAAFGVASLGLEGELWLRKPRYLRGDSVVMNPKYFTSTSLEVCMFYSNHEFSVTGYSNHAEPDLMSSNAEIRLLQIPVILKGSAHISVLDENLRISMGIGIVNSIVLKSHLKEEARIFIRDPDPNIGITGWNDYSDEANTTKSGKRFYNSFCIEFSFGFKRLFIAERAWFSFTDMGWSDEADSWGVPKTHSIYFNAYDTWSKVTYGGGAFSIGWKFN